MASRDDVAEVVVIALVVPDLPSKVRFLDRSAGGKPAYVAEVARQAVRRFDGVWASHCNLAPLGVLAAARGGARTGVSLHGSEAWPIRRALNE